MKIIDSGGIFINSIVAMLENLEVPVQRCGVSDVTDSLAGPVLFADANVTMTDAFAACLGRLRKDAPVLALGAAARLLLEADGCTFVPTLEASIGAEDQCHHDELRLFEGVPTPAVIGRYDAAVVDESTLSANWKVTAHTPAGHIVALRHTEFPREALLFQPASVLTPRGRDIIANFTEMAEAVAG